MELEPDVDSFLEHFGVKGMKWGVRKDPSAGRSAAQDLSRAAIQGSVISGAAFAGRILGASGGLAVSGPGGVGAGAMVGGFVAGRAAAAAIGRSEAKKLKADVDSFKPSSVSNRNAKYTDNMMKTDVKSWGSQGVNRINTKMNSGVSRTQARSDESSRSLKNSMAKFGAGVATNMLISNYGATPLNAVINKGQAAAKSTGVRAAANRAARSAATKNANTRGLPAALKVTKPRRDGSYRI